MDREIGLLQAWEPLYIWRYWARRFAAALRVGSRLVDNHCPAINDWEILTEALPTKRPYVGPASPQRAELDTLLVAWRSRNFEKAETIANKLLRPYTTGKKSFTQLEQPLENWLMWRSCLPSYFAQHSVSGIASSFLNEWINLSEIGPRINEERRVEIRTDTLFAGLLWQLITAFGRSSGVAICYECGKIFEPKRKPPLNVRHFCLKKQCKKASRRLATQDLRKRRNIVSTNRV